MGGQRRINVELGSRSYPIVIGQDWLGEVATTLDLDTKIRRTLLVTQQPVVDAGHVAPVETSLRKAGINVATLTIDDTEASKTAATLARVWDAAATMPLSRQDAIVAVGGGVVGDLAGFAAATYNRGIAVIQVPTTLLAQVDAAIGGKTGINLEHGKNLVGAFHQPVAVAIDVNTLTTLPARTYREGFGEIVKCGLIADPTIFTTIEEDPSLVIEGDTASIEELVARSAAVKADIVGGDEREGGRRAWLNFGHTWGHVVEAASGYGTMLHGEAVAVGMMVALHLGNRMGHTPDDLITRTATVLDSVALPTVSPQIDQEAAEALMMRDKKVADGTPRFVVLNGLGQPEVVTPDADLLWGTLRDLGAVR